MSRLGLAMAAVLAALPALADQSECAPAVDMADSYNAVNRLGDCDYSDEGINRWWGQEQGDDDAASAASSSSAPAARSSSASVRRLRSQPLDGPLDLAKARYELLQRATADCPMAAQLVRELYQRHDDGALTLILEFECSDAP